MAICSSARAAGICTAERGSCLRPLHEHQPATFPPSHRAPHTCRHPSLGPPHPAPAGTRARDSAPDSGEQPHSLSATSFSSSLTSLRDRSLLVR